MKETQASISLWAAETFGPVGSNLRVAARANEEMSELLRALTAEENSLKAPAEIADVLIVLYRLASRLGATIDEVYAVQSGEEFGTTTRLATLTNNSLAHLLLIMSEEPNYNFGTLLGVITRRLHRLAHRLGVDLHEEVDKKMAINRARVWNLDGTGHGYHVRDKSVTP